MIKIKTYKDNKSFETNTKEDIKNVIRYFLTVIGDKTNPLLEIKGDTDSDKALVYGITMTYTYVMQRVINDFMRIK